MANGVSKELNDQLLNMLLAGGGGPMPSADTLNAGLGDIGIPGASNNSGDLSPEAVAQMLAGAPDMHVTDADGNVLGTVPNVGTQQEQYNQAVSMVPETLPDNFQYSTTNQPPVVPQDVTGAGTVPGVPGSDNIAYGGGGVGMVNPATFGQGPGMGMQPSQEFLTQQVNAGANTDPTSIGLTADVNRMGNTGLYNQGQEGFQVTPPVPAVTPSDVGVDFATIDANAKRAGDQAAAEIHRQAQVLGAQGDQANTIRGAIPQMTNQVLGDNTGGMNIGDIVGNISVANQKDPFSNTPRTIIQDPSVNNVFQPQPVPPAAEIGTHWSQPFRDIGRGISNQIGDFFAGGDPTKLSTGMSDHMTKGGQLGQWVSSPKGQRLMADIAGAFAGGTQGQDSWQNRLANVAKEQAKGRSQTYMNQGVGQPQVQPSGVTVGGGVGTNQQSNTVQDSTNVGGLLAGGGLSGDVGFGQEKKKSPFPLGDSDTQSKNAGLSQEEIDNAIKENPTGDHTPAERSTDEMILDRLQNSQNTAFPVFNDVGGTLANSDFFTGKDVSQMLGGLTPEEQIAFNKSKQELRKGEQDITSAQQNDAYKQAMIDIYQKQGRKLVQRKDGAMVDQYTGEVITPPPALPEKVYSIAPGGKLVDAQGNEIALGQDKKITPKLTKKYEAMDPDGSGQIGHYWQDEQGNMEWKPDLLTTNERFKQQDKAVKNIDNSLSTSLEGMYTDGFVRSINPNTGQTEVSYSMTPSGNVARIHKAALMKENYLNKFDPSIKDNPNMIQYQLPLYDTNPDAKFLQPIQDNGAFTGQSWFYEGSTPPPVDNLGNPQIEGWDGTLHLVDDQGNIDSSRSGITQPIGGQGANTNTNTTTNNTVPAGNQNVSPNFTPPIDPVDVLNDSLSTGGEAPPGVGKWNYNNLLKAFDRRNDPNQTLDEWLQDPNNSGHKKKYDKILADMNEKAGV